MNAKEPGATQPPKARAATMPVDSVVALVELLKKYRLLDSSRLNEVVRDLAPHAPEPRALARELMQRGWLTAFQINRLFQGKPQELQMGSYLLLEPLGEGGMGTVFKARHTRLDRIDALKFIRKSFLAKPNAIERFQREARAAARLSHPNVISVYDAGESGDAHFLAMEYAPGTDLARLIKEKGPLPYPKACDYIRQAAMGLAHAHERGLIHRDIKPSNLLLTQDGKTVKLLDLGLARLQSSEDEETRAHSLTETGAVVGTPDFIAPEQARNVQQIDTRADLYSLGCTLYYLLCGKIPFPGETLTEKLIKHQLEEPPAIEQICRDLPPGVVEVVHRLMEKLPENRFQTPEEVVTAREPFVPAMNVGGAEPAKKVSPLMGRPPLAVPVEDLPVARFADIPDETAVLRQRLTKGQGRRFLLPAIAGGAFVLLLLLGCAGLWALIGFSKVAEVASQRSTRPSEVPGTKPAGTSPAAAANAEKLKFHLDRGNDFHHARNYDQAIEEYTIALKQDPKSTVVLNNRGTSYKAKGQFDQAIADYSEAIRLDPKFVDAYYNRATAYYNKGDYNQSLADNTRVIELDPRNAPAFNNRGTLYSFQKQYDRAILDFSEALRLDPGYVAGYGNRGNAYLAKGDREKAMADFSEGIRRDPKISSNYNNRGYIYHLNGDFDAAIADFDTAVKLNPKFAMAFYNRCRSHEKKGNAQQAAADRKRAIELDPNFAKRTD